MKLAADICTGLSLLFLLFLQNVDTILLFNVAVVVVVADVVVAVPLLFLVFFVSVVAHIVVVVALF
jgi:hypothetical protein